MKGWILHPPYLTWQHATADALQHAPLGSIVFGSHAALQRPEWNPPTGMWVPRLCAEDEAPEAPPTPEVAVQLIRARPVPTAPMLAHWLAQRLAAEWILPGVLGLTHAILGSPVRGAGGGGGGVASTRNLRYLAGRWLNCRYGDVRRIIALAVVPRPVARVKELASHTGVSQPRLRDQVTRLLGVTLISYNRWPGWEWVLEAAVRRGVLTAGAPSRGQSTLAGLILLTSRQEQPW